MLGVIKTKRCKFTLPPILLHAMPPTYSIWSTTTIILVGNLNMVRGTTITNTDSFNVVETSVTGQSLSNTSLGKFIVGFEASITVNDL